VALVTPEALAKHIVVGPDPGNYLAKIDEYAQAGFDHVYIHQVGPDQAGFIRFAEREILPRYAATRSRAA
jgi:coenzyme F420-dependent glucose-6-phosphate dehydrogenase